MNISNDTAILLSYIIGFLATPVFFVVAGVIRITQTLIGLTMDSSMLITYVVDKTKERRNIYN
jgi:hypothetical protein|tara:strand:- start:1626 stop:1814 length:189 start_codon:yes stop_codon:yes gene_type:complete